MRSVSILASYLGVAAASTIPRLGGGALSDSASLASSFESAIAAATDFPDLLEILEGSEPSASSFELDVLELGADFTDGNITDSAAVIGIVIAAAEELTSNSTNNNSTEYISIASIMIAAAEEVYNSTDGNSTEYAGVAGIIVAAAEELSNSADGNSTDFAAVIGIAMGTAEYLSPNDLASDPTLIVIPQDGNSTGLGSAPAAVVEAIDFNSTDIVAADSPMKGLAKLNFTDVGPSSRFICNYTTIPGHCCETVTTSNIGVNCFKADMFITPDQNISYYCPAATNNQDMLAAGCCRPNAPYEVVTGLNLYDCRLGMTYPASQNIKREYGDDEEEGGDEEGFNSDDKDLLKN